MTHPADEWETREMTAEESKAHVEMLRRLAERPIRARIWCPECDRTSYAPRDDDGAPGMCGECLERNEAVGLAFDHGRTTEEAGKLWHAAICTPPVFLAWKWRACAYCATENPYRPR